MSKCKANFEIKDTGRWDFYHLLFEDFLNEVRE
jgi:hypothetical protein